MSIASVVLDYTKTRLTTDEIVDIAEIGYTTIITFLSQSDGVPRPCWLDAPIIAKTNAANAVRKIANNLTRSAMQIHEEWRLYMKSKGWRYDKTYDAARKFHPQVLPYTYLPLKSQQQDKLFHSVVRTLIEFNAY